MKPLRWRVIFISALTLLAIWGISPTLIYFSQPKEIRNDAEEFLKKVPDWLPQSHVKLGLDLQGGVQLVLGVQTEGAIENRLSRVGVELKRWAKEKKLEVEAAYVPNDEQNLHIVLANVKDLDQFKVEFIKEYPHLNLVSKNNKTLSYNYKETEIERIKKSALEQAERVIRNRIDQWGVSEPMINRRADGSILVQLPGFRNPQKAKELLGRTAQLKFKIVDDTFKGFDKINKIPAGITLSTEQGQRSYSSEDRDQLSKFLSEYVPADRELLFSREQLGDGTQGRYRWTSYVLFASTELTGDDIQDAVLAQGQTLDRRPVVSLRLTGSGGRQFARITGENIRKRMAIVLDDVIESAPVINEKISGGQASISLGGNRSHQEMVDEGTQLALVLKSGAIPATITVLEERQVGASLGPELANQGVKGILLGLSMVLLFMLFYYRRPGIIACCALVLNAVLLLAVMAAFGFALTLPGIAGFVLTLGMAVDANVLINERIRQEIREGRHPRKAVESGFKKVFWTIVDANVTTLIAALVLLETNSSGPIRGFAITLMIGLIVSLFTSLYCSHLFFDVAMTQISDKRIKFWLGGEKALRAKNFSFDFVKFGSKATTIAAFLSLAVVGTSFVKGMNFGVDFSGGTEVMVRFSENVEASEIQAIGNKAKVEGLTLQALEGGKKQYLLRYDESKEDAEGQKAVASDVFIAFKHSLQSDLASKQPEILQVDFVGPQIGKELRTQGMLSVLYAILAVILYIAFRFDMRFSPGALIKMFLDIFIMMGFYVFFWASFDLVAVAAFLTVVGYSVNDTIVIYDRIRENLTNHPRRNLKDNINISINETLSRSINTSLTTVVSLFGILMFGSGQIWNFAMAMTIGVVVATLSSIFVASSFVLWLEFWKKSKHAQKVASKNA